MGNNSVILTDKKLGKIHYLHIAITNLNRQLWIRIYNGFSEIPDIRQTGITKTWQLLGKKFPVDFSMCPVNLFAKRIIFIPPSFFYNRSLNLQRNLKEI